MTFDVPSKRRWPYVLVGAALGVVGTIIASTALATSDAASGEAIGPDLELATAPVEVRDLVEEIEWVADLGYGTSVEVTATADTTITRTTAPGTALGRGDVVFEANDDPVVLFYGELPFWRAISIDEEGPDVEQLETNLVALGYDPDATVTIDDTFTSNTGLMVERWQEDIGAEVNGEVALGDVIGVPGPVSVTTIAPVGMSARSGSALATLSVRADTTTVVGSSLGQISSLVDLGTVVESGTILYEVDDVRVMALTTTDTIAGYLVDPGRGLPVTGHTSADAYVFVPPDLEVSALLVDVGDTLAAPHPIVELSAPTLSVVIPVGLADQDEFIIGQIVDVELPDDSVVAGVVADVGSVAQVSPGEDPTIEVTVEITDLVGDDLPAAEVTVVVAGETVTDALVVPTRALVTLAEGGFAVEKVLSDATTVLVAVETGSYDDGVVEVETSQLEPGDALVVPQ